MPRHWDIFPRQPWPRSFGLREPYRPQRPHLDRDQLELEFGPRAAESVQLSPLDNVRAVWRRSQLARRDFAQWVLGCTEESFGRYLRGAARASEVRRNQFAALESVALHGDRLVIVVRTGAAVRRLARWRLAERRR